ncbi:MAG TPA: hypothetical protein VJ898_11695 [Natrialbaceae archaeon]|nr:hypothetical protein [Natrialbaceae archaeon]
MPIRHGVRIARIDVVRGIRKNTATRLFWIRILLYVGLVGVPGLLAGYVAYLGGQELAAGRSLASIETVELFRTIVAFVWAFAFLIVTFRTVGGRGYPTTARVLLATVPVRDVVLGILLAEMAFATIWMVPFAVASGVGFAVGAGTLSPLLTVPATAAVVIASTVVIGFTVGIILRQFATRVGFVVRHKAALSLLLIATYFMLLTTDRLELLFESLAPAMRSSPIGWGGDLSVLGMPGVDPSPGLAIGWIGLAALLVPTLVVVGGRVAAFHWLSDPSVPVEPSSERVGPPVPVERSGILTVVIPALVGKPMGALVRVAWWRAIRAPMKFVYVAYPLLFVGAILVDVIETGGVPASLPAVVLIAVAWGSGVLFVLNPLGDQGRALPATIMTGITGRQFVRGHLLATLLVTLPLGLVATIATVLVSPLDSATALVVVLLCPAVIVASATLAVGIGTAFPRFTATSVTRSTRVVLPSSVAVLAYSVTFGLGIGSGAAVYSQEVRQLAATFLSWALPFGLSVSTGLLYSGSIVILVPVLFTPFLAYRYAVRRFDAVTLD